MDEGGTQETCACEDTFAMPLLVLSFLLQFLLQVSSSPTSSPLVASYVLLLDDLYRTVCVNERIWE